MEGIETLDMNTIYGNNHFYEYYVVAMGARASYMYKTKFPDSFVFKHCLLSLIKKKIIHTCGVACLNHLVFSERNRNEKFLH